MVNKKVFILSAVILLALSMLLAACQADTNAPAEISPYPSAPEAISTESVHQTEPTGTRGETEMSPVDQMETDEEMNVGNLLVPDITEGKVPSEEKEHPEDTPTEGGIQQSTEPQSTEPENVPEETLPDVTQAPNDGYSNYWY